MRRCRLLACLALGLPLAACGTSYFAPPAPSAGFTNFETEPVQPLALSQDGVRLYALNTADDRLEIFAPTPGGLRSVGETMVGLRPVALTVRAPGEVWVANHLSDTVNVVDVSRADRPRVMRTLAVGDEPRGIVAAGPDRRWVFVATARRGEALTPGIGRGQVWIFDGHAPDRPPRVLTLFATKIRALAASPDGRRVYAAPFHSGNGTTTVGGIQAASLGRSPVFTSEHPPQPRAKPKAGAIVRRVDGKWRDFAGLDWSKLVPFDLPDYDVFVIDATGAAPHVVERVSGVGTTLFSLAVRPGDGEVWVANTEARNVEPTEPRLRARFATNRITRLRRTAAGWSVRPVGLNPHVDETRPTGTARERALSLAQPVAVAFDPGSGAAYVAAFGSRKVAVLDKDARVVNRIEVGFGPAGLALDPARERLYVHNRLDASITVIDTRSRRTIATVPLRHDPTPAAVRAGRPLLYDARNTSGHGTVSCATCHVFADFDHLAWNLGNPEGPVVEIPETMRNPLAPPRQAYHPLKGAMMTQSLHGLTGTGPLHWRGDRFGRNAPQPGEEIASFKDFDAAFADLMGRTHPPSDAAMEAFARFVHTIRYPPNPNEPLDRDLRAEAAHGFAFFTGDFLSDRGAAACHDCHAGPLGTNGLVNFEGFDAGRDMKTAHLRNVYQKVGRFDRPGPQVSGYGFAHDGSLDTIVRFLKVDAFDFPGRTEEEKDAVRRDLSAFVMAFHTGMAPAVGRQITLAGPLDATGRAAVDQVVERAGLGECDLVARAWIGGRERGWLWSGGAFRPDRRADPPIGLEALIARGGDKPVNLLCVPPGDGVRSALDRDLDGRLDGDAARRAGVAAR